MKKARPIMIQGTMSNAGKSLVCAALCRIFARRGLSVAPFKSQNMALNSFIPDEGLEMGRAQVVQAEAAFKKPSVLMNPILLKPTTDVGSQVIVNGEVRGNMRAAEYFRHKKELVPDVMRAYETLAAENDIIVIEGAGSPAEINLKSQDIVNMGLAKMVSSPVVLVGDIDRGGVFAQLYGTVALLEPDERAMVKATVINKFRGDVEILKPGLDMLYDLVHVPCAGVVPYLNVDIDDEDSLSERLSSGARRDIDIAVIQLPRISNFTDFAPFSRFSQVSLRYIRSLRDLGDPDMIIVPGTKSTVSDLLWMRQNGLEAQIKKFAARGTPVFGVCGGLQILGGSISDPHNTEGGGEARGMGLLPVDTVFAPQKTRLQTSGVFENLSGVLSRLNGLAFSGYEIHSGVGAMQSKVISSGNIYGTYVHGVFDSEGVAAAVVSALCDKKGMPFGETDDFDPAAYKESQYDLLADAVESALDMRLVEKILEEGI